MNKKQDPYEFDDGDRKISSNKNKDASYLGRMKEEKLRKAVGRVLIALSFKKKPSKNENRKNDLKEDPYSINGEETSDDENEQNDELERVLREESFKRKREPLICLDDADQGETGGSYDISTNNLHGNFSLSQNCISHSGLSSQQPKTFLDTFQFSRNNNSRTSSSDDCGHSFFVPAITLKSVSQKLYVHPSELFQEL